MITIIIIICLAYIFGAIGYGFTLIKGFDKKLKKFDKVIVTFCSSIWPFWMFVLGFAVTMTEIEYQLKKFLGYRY